MKTTPRVFLTAEQTDELISGIKNDKHRLMVLLMLDCGLTVSQCVRLQASSFDLDSRILLLYSLGKDKKSSVRSIPLSTRLHSELVRYGEAREGSPLKNGNAFIFPSNNVSGHICRSTVNKILIRNNSSPAIPRLHPHTLRHTYAKNQLSAGMQIQKLGELLGHSHRRSASAYSIPPVEESGKEMELTEEPTEYVAKSGNNSAGPPTCVTVGRKDIIDQLNDLIQRKVNVVIIGAIGVGKSHLLKEFEESVKASVNIKVLKLEDTKSLKSALAQMLIFILKTDQQGVYQFLFPGYDYNEAVIRLSRESIAYIAKEIIKLTERKFYTLIIDNVDQIGSYAVRILELFKDHFTIVTTARAIPVNRSSFLWNFEIIRLQPLSRAYSLKLIDNLSVGLAPDDLTLYKNHIYEQTIGNPRAIEEIIERYRKEGFISKEVIRRIRHTGALPEYDCTFIVLIFLACVACLRYLNHEVQNASFRVLGGIALVFLFITRYFFRFSRKTNV
jgi:integrase/recombinase XerD